MVYTNFDVTLGSHCMKEGSISITFGLLIFWSDNSLLSNPLENAESIFIPLDFSRHCLLQKSRRRAYYFNHPGTRRISTTFASIFGGKDQRSTVPSPLEKSAKIAEKFRKSVSLKFGLCKDASLIAVQSQSPDTFSWQNPIKTGSQCQTKHVAEIRQTSKKITKPFSLSALQSLQLKVKELLWSKPFFAAKWRQFLAVVWPYVFLNLFKTRPMMLGIQQDAVNNNIDIYNKW